MRLRPEKTYLGPLFAPPEKAMRITEENVLLGMLAGDPTARVYFLENGVVMESRLVKRA